MQKNIPKGLLMITLTFLFTLTIAGAAFAATGDQVTNAIVTPNTLPLVNSNSTQGGNDQFVVNTTPAQGFPTNGSSYANINTGNAAESSANLTLNLTIPQGAKTLSFDWRFATNDYPPFNDWAKAEIVDGNSVTNVLLLPNGKKVDVQNALSYLSPTYPNNIGYARITPMYTTTTDISAYAGKNILLVLSVADAVDTDFTSALFIDNLHIKTIADLNLNEYTNDGNNWNYHTQHTFYVNLTNKGYTANNVVLTDTLPPGLQFVSASDGGSYSNGVITWNIGTLNAGASILRNITVYVTGHNILATNTATATTSTYEANTNDNTGSLTINVHAAASIDISKEFWKDSTYIEVINSANYHDNIWTVIKAHNYGPDNATNVQISDTLPLGLVPDYSQIWLSTDGANNWILTSSYSGNTWTITDLPNGAEYWLAIWTQVTAHNTTVINTATQTGQYQYPYNGYDSSTASLTVAPAANVDLANEFRGTYNGSTITQANYHDVIWAVISSYNKGPDNATMTIANIPAGFIPNGNYTVSYDNGLTWVGVDGSFTDGIWTIHIPAGLTYLLAIPGQVNQTSTVTNTANQTAQDIYHSEQFETITTSLNVPPAADVVVTKTWENTSGSHITNANYLDTVVSHITVTNNGPDNANSVVLTDHLPAGFQLNAAQSYIRYGQLDSSRWSLADCTDWSYDEATGLFTWNITKHLGVAMYSGLANACEVWLYFTNTAHNNTQVLNTAEVDPQSSEQYDPNTSNNVATSSYTANAAANVGVTKEFRTDYQNSTSTTNTANYYTPIWVMVHVTNAGPDAVDGLQVTDILPAGLTYLNEYFVSHDGGLTWTVEDVYNATTGVWNIGSMLNGADYWLAVLAQVDGHNTTITNVANKTQSTFDWNATNDNGNATLTVPAAADVYVNTSTSKNNPNVGEKVVVRVKAGNNGPDAAQNVIVTYNVPEGMEFVSLAWEAGYPAPVYDPTTRTVTWNLGNLAVIDPWMDITLRAVSAGATSGDASVSSDTYDPVSGNNLESGAISVEQVQVNAATVDSTVPMQKTGLPIGMILTALLVLLTGFVMPRRK
ncbi:DUF11 domain-containing protein [Methanobacterium aggregans]|uniref:DUF11 domain-containing protein n=1 Tax=Methanobacterium aggregans TaxID=1615586 RepID=UPI001AE694D1|nr:putative repeat protein (TIGR01451 family) [Methanobacterium aggregans]